MKALEVYEGSDGELTKAYYKVLAQRGPIGIIAMNLFRAQKCSARAKVYRGGIRGVGSFKSLAYEKKSWSMDLLVAALAQHGESLGISYGWKPDPSVPFGDEPSWVLYIDLPQGQVSFHSPTRMSGPEYAGDWDRTHLSAARIVQFCDSVFNAPHPDQLPLEVPIR